MRDPTQKQSRVLQPVTWAENSWMTGWEKERKGERDPQSELNMSRPDPEWYVGHPSLSAARRAYLCTSTGPVSYWNRHTRLHRGGIGIADEEEEHKADRWTPGGGWSGRDGLAAAFSSRSFKGGARFKKLFFNCCLKHYLTSNDYKSRL